MGRLKALKSTIATLPPRIGYAPGDEKAADRQRNVMAPWRAWYQTPRWRKLRQQIMLRDLYTCQMCRRTSIKGMVVDHRTPHRGKEALFWSEANLQVLCADPCHNKHKQALEQATPTGVWD